MNESTIIIHSFIALIISTIIHEIGHIIIIIFCPNMMYEGITIDINYVTVMTAIEPDTTLNQFYFLYLSGIGLCYIIALILSVILYKKKSPILIMYSIYLILASTFYVLSGIGDFTNIKLRDSQFGLNIYTYTVILSIIISIICFIPIINILIIFNKQLRKEVKEE